MTQLIGFGNGSDGDAVLSSHNPIDSQCTGIAGNKSLSATNASFASGQIIKIRQEQNGSYGAWELNVIDTYVPGTITTLFPLANTYISLSQVIVVPQYRSVVLSASFSIKAWNGAVGGHLTFFCSGKVLNNSGITIDGKGRGFRGGDRENSGVPPVDAEKGDSPAAAATRGNTANGTGGGGAGDRNGSVNGDTGGGAGHADAGNSVPVTDSDVTGDPGAAIDTTELSTRFCMGAGGGGGVGPGGNDIGGFGGPGGATFDIYCREFENQGTFDFSGGAGNTLSQYGSYNDGVGAPSTNPLPGGSKGCGGGGGAAGAGQVTCNSFTNSGSILFAPGSGGTSNTGLPTAGAGSRGIFKVNCCSYSNTGTITGLLITNIGGQSFCISGGFIY